MDKELDDMSRRVKLALSLSSMHCDNHNPDGGGVGLPHIVNPGLHRGTGRHKQVPTVSAEVPMRCGSSDGLCVGRVKVDDAKSAKKNLLKQIISRRPEGLGEIRVRVVLIAQGDSTLWGV